MQTTQPSWMLSRRDPSEVTVKTVHVVQTIPVRDGRGEILGWVRADPLSDGLSPSDRVYLRDGSAPRQVEAAARIAMNPCLLYPTRESAVDDGLAGLRARRPLG